MTNSIKLHTKDEFQKMRKAGSIASECLDHITEFVKPGISTLELDEICFEFQKKKVQFQLH